MDIPVPKISSERSGFTLIELMVVVVLIGVMTAMILPEMKGTYGDALLRSTGRKMVDVLSLANSRAITINQIHRVRIDRKNGRYFIERTVHEGEKGSHFVPVRDIPGGEGTIDTRISVEFRQVEEDFSGGEQGASSVTGNNSQKEIGDESIAFYPDGTSDAGAILLRDTDGFRLALRINPTTARVYLAELEHE